MKDRRDSARCVGAVGGLCGARGVGVRTLLQEKVGEGCIVDPDRCAEVLIEDVLVVLL